ARKSLLRMAREGKVMTAHDALSSVITASALHACELLDLRNIFEVMGLIVEMQQECALEIEVAHPGIAQKKEFADFRKHLEILKGTLAERRYTVDSLQTITAYQQKAAELVSAVFTGAAVEVSLPEEPGKPAAPKKEAPKIDGMPAYQDWEQVK